MRTRPKAVSPEEAQREHRRAHLEQLDEIKDLTPSQRVLRDRLRCLDNADPATGQERYLRRALGLD